MADPSKHAEIAGMLTGPPASHRPAGGDQGADENGIVAPSWWGGDDDAYTSSRIAAAQASG